MGGVFWAAASVSMYPLGIVNAMRIGPRSTPPTVLVGALLLVIGEPWMVGSVLRNPSPQIGVEVQPRVHDPRRATFGESMPEAHLPRRCPLGVSVNRGNR